MRINHLLVGLFFILIIAISVGCGRDDSFYNNPDGILEFSVDTLMFDTVFTELGSATRILKVFNPRDQQIKISKIFIESGSNTKFRINIDGDPLNSTEDVIIPANDSLYIFGEVTIDPDAPLSDSPFVIYENVVFETNGNIQKVVFEAFGQNANYFPSRFDADSINYFGCAGGDVVWDDPKPYVIYGIVVFEDCTLVLPAGCEVYLHGGLGQFEDDSGNPIFYNDGRLVIGPNGSIRSEGTLEDPVIIQGDRLEQEFDDISGQWYGILINGGSVGNSFDHTIIKNSVLGVVADSLSELTLTNTQIFNTSSNALIGRSSTIKAENCLFYNNGATAIRTILGGNYEFNHCSVGAFGSDQQAIAISNVQCLPPLCQEYYSRPLYARMNNCIFFGSNADLVSLEEVDDFEFDYFFDHCIVRVEDLLKPERHPDFFDFTNATINAERNDPVFVNVGMDNYHLDTLSIAEGKGVFISGLELDLDGESRDATNPDLGCYEYIYE